MVSGLPLQSQTCHQHGNSSWCQWGWLCGHSRLGLSKVSVNVLLRALSYHCVLPCAARLQLLNLVAEEQQAASWQGTFCSFLLYLSIPSDQVLGNNWHLPDLAMFVYHSQIKFLQMEVNLLEVLTLPKSVWICWELLFRLFLCLTCASKHFPSSFMLSSPKKETSQRCCTIMDFSCSSWRCNRPAGIHQAPGVAVFQKDNVLSVAVAPHV